MSQVDIGDMIAVAIWDGSHKKERRAIVVDKHRATTKHRTTKEWTYTIEWLDSNEHDKVYESEQGSRWFRCVTILKSKLLEE
jgi:hypothetical protein